VGWDFDGTESSLAIVAWGTNNLGLRKGAPATKQQTTHLSHNIEAIAKLRAFHFIVTTIIATSKLKMQVFTSWVEHGSTDRSRMQQYCIISSPEQTQSSSPLQNQFSEKRRQEEEEEKEENQNLGGKKTARSKSRNKKSRHHVSLPFLETKLAILPKLQTL
jgi:hypothetical protein